MIPWIFAASGLAALLAALLPGLLSRLPVSEPMVFLGAGVIAWLLFDQLGTPDPIEYGVATEHLTEVCVIIALMGAGLAIDRPVSWRGWGATWRLLAITMPLTIILVAVIGWWGLGLAPAAAMLLGAALAPTDPVLASDVQVAEPSDEPNQEDEVRFALTSEAGLNDGLAFPFTYAAVAIGLAGLGPGEWFGGWLLFDVVYRLAVGVAMGIGVGWLLSRLIFRRTLGGALLAERGDGFVALAATFLAYGVTELVNGYGFIAVFVCACSIRSSERQHGYHGVMHNFIEQVERLVTVVVLVLLGGAIARGLLAPLTWADGALAVALLFVIRPVFAWIALLGSAGTRRERAAMAFFGVRGIGSIYYLAFGIEKLGEFEDAARLWAIVGLVVTLSVVIHGVSAHPAMRHVDEKREERRRVRQRRRTDRPGDRADVARGD
jgi:NhaP-type Na+/H+ or K+/H+ antiporter